MIHPRRTELFHRTMSIVPLFLLVFLVVSDGSVSAQQGVRKTPPPVPRYNIAPQGSRDDSGRTIFHGWIHAVYACGLKKPNTAGQPGSVAKEVSHESIVVFQFAGSDGVSFPVRLSNSLLTSAGGYLALEGRPITIRGRFAQSPNRSVNAAVPLAEMTQAGQTFIVETLGAAPFLQGPRQRTGTGKSIDATAPVAKTTGFTSSVNLPYITILVRFSDFTGTTPRPARYYETLFQETAPGLGHYFREQSYGKMNITGSRVVGWVNLPRTSAFYARPNDPLGVDWIQAIKDACAAADLQVDFTRYYGINIMTNVGIGNFGGVGSRLTLTLDGQTRTWGTTLNNPVQGHSLLAHEMGHSLGWPHSSGPYGEVYDSGWDVMSSGDWGWNLPSWPGQGVGTIALHRLLPRYFRWAQTPWIADDRSFVALPGTDKTIRLERLTQPTGTPGYLMATVYSGSSTNFYTIEARRFAGYDTKAGIPGEGIIIHHVDMLRPEIPTGRSISWVMDADNNGNCNDAGAIWTPGETFRDTDRGIIVQVLRQDATGYTVRIVVDKNQPLPSDVTNTRDSGPGSLRDAITFATQFPNVQVRFRIPTTDPNFENGVFRIPLLTPLPELLQSGTQIDGATQTAFTGNTNPDGPEIEIDGAQITDWGRGFALYSGNNRIHGVAVVGFSAEGIAIDGGKNRQTDDWPYFGRRPDRAGTANRITDCYLGVAADGKTGKGNRYAGVFVGEGATDNRIGGSGRGERNLIGGSKESNGVHLHAAAGTLIQGNYLGTDVTGTNPLANAFSGVSVTGGSRGTVIGGTRPGEGNLISGNNGTGIWIGQNGTTNTTVRGNRIGTNAGGTAALPNVFDGIAVNEEATLTFIGGVTATAGNLISGNRGNGLWIGGKSRQTYIQGNRIGTDAVGTAAIPNKFAGVALLGATHSNLVGGTATGATNLISGNAGNGLWVGQANTHNNLILGNVIGLDSSGLLALGNTFDGVALTDGATNNQVGAGDPGARNIISGNGGSGIWIGRAGTASNSVEGNWIGVDITGQKTVGNTWEGIAIVEGAKNNRIGGTTPGAGNVLTGNKNTGIILLGADTTGNVIQGNRIGLSADGLLLLSNGWGAIGLFDGPNNNLIGGNSGAARNYIAANGNNGIWLSGVGTRQNRIQGNVLGLNIENTPLEGPQFNFIGLVQGASDNLIGGTATGEGNIIRGTRDSGIWMGDNTTLRNSVLGNLIFENRNRGITLSDGANANIAAPVLTAITATQVQGRVSGAAGATFRVEVFSNLATDTSPQGRAFLSASPVVIGANGTGTFTIAISGQPRDTRITTTATDASGNTSVFSNALSVP